MKLERGVGKNGKLESQKLESIAEVGKNGKFQVGKL